MIVNARRFLGVGMLATVVSLSAACNRDEEPAAETNVPPATEEVATEALTVSEVDLGKSIGADMRVSDNDDTDDFAPADTIYASVETTGSATGSTLTARWTFEDGQVVDESSQTISPTGPTVTEFHISKPDGFPAGEYEVAILLNGTSVETKSFEVQ